jgi:sugar phosphate isomerase/epimerase
VHAADEPSEPGAGGRALPGEGGTQTAEIVRALRANGWGGYLDVEIFSTVDGFWGLPVDEAARRAHAAARALL